MGWFEVRGADGERQNPAAVCGTSLDSRVSGNWAWGGPGRVIERPLPDGVADGTRTRDPQIHNLVL